jgi:hypothetical protein
VGGSSLGCTYRSTFKILGMVVESSLKFKSWLVEKPKTQTRAYETRRILWHNNVDSKHKSSSVESANPPAKVSPRKEDPCKARAREARRRRVRVSECPSYSPLIMSRTSYDRYALSTKTWNQNKPNALLAISLYFHLRDVYTKSVSTRLIT